MLRSAKVVCQAGEYVCLVRDVCEDGVLLSYLHEVPPEARIILALANAQTYPVERTWSADNQAGYRFAGSMALEEFLHESAPFSLRPVRLTIPASARILDGATTLTALLRDISTHGASFACDRAMDAGRLISFQLGGLPQQLAEIVWSKPGDDADGMSTHIGIQFRQPLTLRELAAVSLRLQPFAPKPAAPANQSANQSANQTANVA
jgi:hypothetical protein